MISDKIIILFTMSLWNEPRRGRHHYAKALSENNNLVIWVNRRYFEDEPFDNRVGAEYINDKLIILHTGMSFISRRMDEYFNINNRFRLKLLDELLCHIGKPDILWVYDYKSIDVVNYFGNGVVSLYFCNDFFGNKAFWLYERRLAKAVDHVICTDPRLVEKFESINGNSYFIPHGLWPIANRPSFSKKQNPSVLGYVGTLNGTVDIEFFEKILNETQCEIILAGPIVECDDMKREKFEKLINKERVRYYGVVEQDQINELLSRVDICLLPYINKFDGFALKFFDYLNNGKPILATTYDFVWPSEFEKFVKIYNKKMNLKKILNETYQSWDKEKFEEAIRIANRSTWKDRIQQVSQYIKI